MSAVGGFPTGPFKLRTKFLLVRGLGIGLLGLFAAAAAIVYPVMGWQRLTGIWHDDTVWDAGGAELPAEVDGKVTTRQFVLKSYALQVAYITPDGQRHDHELELDTLFGGIDEEMERTVRVSPDNPDDFALSAAVTSSGTRYAGAGFFLVAGWLLAGVMGFAAWKAGQQFRRVSRAAQRGTLTSALLVSREPVMTNGRDSGSELIKFQVPSGQAPVMVEYQLRTKKDALLTMDGGRRVLALVPSDKPTDAIAILESLYPLALSNEDSLRLRQAFGS